MDKIGDAIGVLYFYLRKVGYMEKCGYFAKLRWQKCEIYAIKHIFLCKKFGGYVKKQYLCTVFFMVLDLRLSKGWVVAMTILLFFIL